MENVTLWGLMSLTVCFCPLTYLLWLSECLQAFLGVSAVHLVVLIVSHPSYLWLSPLKL